MTESSYYWSGIATGDAVYAHYTASEFAEIFRRIFVGDDDRSGRVGGGLIPRYFNQDAFYVTPGAAIIRGCFYYSDAAIVYPVASSQSRYYYYTLVLRRSGNTIRQILLGPDTYDFPTPQQTNYVQDIPLGYVKTGYGTYNVVAPDFRAITPNGFGQILLPKRQGGSATHWATAGTTDYDIGLEPKIMLGVIEWTGGAASSGSKAVTFNATLPFAYNPLAFVTPKTAIPENYTDILVGTQVTTTTLTIYWQSKLRTYTSIVFNWMAIGQVDLL